MVVSWTWPSWVLKLLSKISRNFLWSGSTDTRSGHCHIAWENACEPTILGGLGMHNLFHLSAALSICVEESWATGVFPVSLLSSPSQDQDGSRTPGPLPQTVDLWSGICSSTSKIKRKELNSLVILNMLFIWLERNICNDWKPCVKGRKKWPMPVQVP